MSNDASRGVLPHGSGPVGGTDRLVVVTPVYEDGEAMTRLFAELAATGIRPYVVAVDDGSVYAPVAAGSIAAAGLSGEVLRLRRNVGHQRAIAIGLCHVADNVRGFERVVVMDADGEDRPQSIRTLLECIEDPNVDAVVARRRRRVESLRFRGFYWVYRRVFAMLVGRSIDFGNFVALKPAAVGRLVAMSELWIHVPACVLSSKLRTVHVAIDRGPRYAGRSKMNFVGLALHGFRGLMVFSEDVLVRMGIACTGVAVLCVVGSTVAVAMKFAGLTTPGWSTIVLGVLLLVFLQMGALTLMMLMLTGLMRANSVARVAYKDFVAGREHAGEAPLLATASPYRDGGGRVGGTAGVN